MKEYFLSTKFGFGKYQGKTLKEVVSINPLYIEWCVLNLDHFYMSKTMITELQKLNPKFELSIKANSFLEERLNLLELSKQTSNNYHQERESYGEYSGTYAQDEIGLSDDFINEVLEGDPDAYWNID